MTDLDAVDFDPRDLRRAFGNFATGVTIVTTVDDQGQPRGFTANSFTSVSIDPPLLLVSIARAAYGCETFTRAGGFAVNILARGQRELSNRFASAGTDKFAGISWEGAHSGSPILDGVVAWFDCENFNQVEAGDHVILIGRILNYSHNTSAPLGFCRGAYVSFGLTPQMLQLVSSPGSLKVGAIIESDGRILLERNPHSGQLLPPISETVGDRSNPDSLLGKLASAGIEVDLPFMYAAYHDGSHRYVYYLGELLSVQDAHETRALHFYDFDHITWEEINDPTVIGMLGRYIREKKIGNYGVYIGDQRQGEIHPA